MRKALSMLEMIFTIILIGIVYIAILKVSSTYSAEREVYSELNLYQNIDAAVKESFVNIIDTFEPVCSNIPSIASTRWGWGHNSCSTTSPLPVYSNAGGNRQIDYKIQFSSLSATAATSLENKIVGSYLGVCILNTRNNTQLLLDCPRILNVTYSTGGAFAATIHTLGTPLDPVNAPTIKITYDRISPIGTIAAGTPPPEYDFSLTDIYSLRTGYSLTKMNTLKSSLQRFYNAELGREFNNFPAAGLHSMDDEFVPWFWKVFGDDSALISSLCVVAGGTCANLNSDNIWRSTFGAKGLMKNVYDNLLASDSKYSVDGFGNQLNLYPFVSQCTGAGADFTTCTTTVPPLPQDNYISGTVRPPYSSVLYVQGYGARGVTTPQHTKMYLSY